MSVKELSDEAQKIVSDYLNLPIGGKTVRTPYYNNKHRMLRGGLRALVGKGTPREIAEEALLYSMKEKVRLQDLAPEMLTRFLVDHNLGIDCSGLAYHILDAECVSRGFGHISSHLNYPFHSSLLSRISRFVRRRYVENTDTLTLAHPSNSKEIPIHDIAPGDMIILLDKGFGERNHILIVKSVEVDKLVLIHSIANSEDGKYGHGVRTEAATISGQILNEIQERFRAKNICLRRLNVLS